MKTAINCLTPWFKRTITIVLMLGTLVTAWGILAPGAIAADLEAGKKIFSANCAACHAGGNNLVVGAKNLKQDTLEKFGMASIEAITTQLKNGKGVMPSFSSKLSVDDMENAAAYVLDRAAADWK